MIDVTKLEMKLKEALATVISTYGIKVNREGDLRSIATDYFTLARKLIPQQKMRVFFSQEIMVKLKNYPKKDIIMEIKSRLENARSLIPFLSHRVLESGFHDGMLYEWHIYHLHLSKRIRKHTKFVKRKNELLFIYVENKQAYLLDIDSHRPGVFAEEKWFEIIQQNWPEVMDKFKYQDMKDFYPVVSSEKRQELRDKGYMIGRIKIKDGVYGYPGVGMSISGHSMEVILRVNDLMRSFWKLKDQIENKQEELNESFLKNYNIDANDIELGFYINADGLHLKEINSSLVLAVLK